jgi:acetyl esterase/lipase
MKKTKSRIVVVLTMLLGGVGVLSAGAQLPNDAAPSSLTGSEAKVYKTVGATKLLLHVYQPAERKAGAALPAILFFFGGGWRSGSPAQFVEHCKYLSARGMVVISVEYRVKSRHDVTPRECVADAKSAIRWVRAHAQELGVDSQRIVASGGSAGGHLAAATALVKGFDEPGEDLTISSAPNALVLFNPALDLSGLQSDLGLGEQRLALSPQQQVRDGLPPTIIFHGTEDKTVPYTEATAFCQAMKQRGNSCEVVPFEGREHGFFNYGRGDGQDFKTSLRATDEFLVSLGYLKGKPTPK